MRPLPVPPCPSAIPDELAAAASGLLYLSESEAPFAAVNRPWPADRPLSPASLGDVLGVPPDTPASETTLDAFLAPMIQRADPADPVLQQWKPRYVALEALLQRLLGAPRVFRLGRADADYYVVAVLPGSPPCLAGLSTHAVET